MIASEHMLRRFTNEIVSQQRMFHRNNAFVWWIGTLKYMSLKFPHLKKRIIISKKRIIYRVLSHAVRKNRFFSIGKEAEE